MATQHHPRTSTLSYNAPMDFSTQLKGRTRFDIKLFHGNNTNCGDQLDRNTNIKINANKQDMSNGSN